MLLSVFSGAPLDPLLALSRAGLATVNDEGNLEYPLSAHAALRQLRDRGLIRWVNWQRPENGAAPIPPGYVLTGNGETQLGAYFELYGPALSGRASR